LTPRILAGIFLVSAAGCAPRGPELVALPAEVPPAVLIEGAAVLDVGEGIVSAPRDVLVRGDRIAAIADPGTIPAPQGAVRIDGKGATLLPGLIDMHGHVGSGSAPSWMNRMPDPDANLRAYLYCGVTTVLDPAGLSTQTFDLRDGVASGKRLGPTMYAAGPMVTAPGGHPVVILRNMAPWWLRWYLVPRFARQVDSPAKAREEVAAIAAMGADVLKLAVDRLPEEAPRIRREVLAAAVEEARARGLRAVAHVGTTEDALDAARAGVSAWMHGVYKERIPDGQVAELAGFGIPMVPTIVVFESYALLGQEPRVATPLERETVPADVLSAFDEIPEGDRSARVFASFLEHLRGERESWRDNVRRLRAAGVTILAGSDTQSGVFPGAGLHRELHLLAEAGLSPAEAIRAATLDAARFLSDGAPPEFGVVAEGKRADLLLVDGDPTRDLRVLERIRAVLKGGVPLERRAIDADAR
jgi:imidazolonepropionase-like amidohydrolase